MASRLATTFLRAEIGLDERSLSASVVVVYVFGSFVRGLRASDLDLIVVWDPDLLTPLEALQCACPVVAYPACFNRSSPVSE